MTLYTIRPGFTITIPSGAYTGGESVDLNPEEFAVNKHKLEGVEANSLPSVSTPSEGVDYFIGGTAPSNPVLGQRWLEIKNDVPFLFWYWQDPYWLSESKYYWQSNYFVNNNSSLLEFALNTQESDLFLLGINSNAFVSRGADTENYFSRVFRYKVGATSNDNFIPQIEPWTTLSAGMVESNRFYFSRQEYNLAILSRPDMFQLQHNRQGSSNHQYRGVLTVDYRYIRRD